MRSASKVLRAMLLQAGLIADGPPAPAKVFGKGSKAAPAFGLAALSSPRTPPAQPTPAVPSAAAQTGAAVGVSALLSSTARKDTAVDMGAAVGDGIATVPEASVTGKRQRESVDG